LFSLLTRSEVLKLVDAISKTVAEGNDTSVEVKGEKKDEAMQ
jgi:hypothetical protein